MAAAAIGGTTAAVAQATVASAIPWIMQTTGVVVSGTGTLFAKGGLAATAQMVAATSTGPVVLAGAAVGFGGYYAYETAKAGWNHNKQ